MNNRILFKIIKNCRDCPYCKLDKFSDECRAEEKYIGDSANEIPDWCSLDEMGKPIEACAKIAAKSIVENIIDGQQRVIKNISWMITQLKWQTKTIQNPNLSVQELANISDSQISYSPELHEAMELLEELKND